MAEEENRSEPVTDKKELQKLKVLPFSWAVFLLVITKDPPICYILYFFIKLELFCLLLLAKHHRNNCFHNNGFHLSISHRCCFFWGGLK